MSANKVRYPGPGCLVEFMQGNTPTQAVVLEEQGGRLRLYGINHRESALAANRLLPWTGPQLKQGGSMSREQMDEALEDHRALRATIASEISPLEVWELTQGEIGKTSAEWLAGLIWEQPGIDQEAALGHVLLQSKTHFRFSPPDFEIFPADIVASRLAEAESARLREAFAVTGAQFFQKLWEIHSRKRGQLTPQELPEQELAERLKAILFSRIADPDASEDAAVWKLLVKSLPDVQHLPLMLATAWELVPEHYNFWLDRADYQRGEDWAGEFAAECDALPEKSRQLSCSLPTADVPFVSADPAETTDRDDAFYVARTAEHGYEVQVCLACPACVWPFGSGLDKAVMRRSTSLYLPEGDLHMIPAAIGKDLFSLDAGQPRPALVLSMRVSPDGELLEAVPRLCSVSLKHNLDLEACEALFQEDSGESDGLSAMLRTALELARLLQEKRIAEGAVITERPDPEVRLEDEQGQIKVHISDGPEASLTHLVVGELMVLANGAIASWAVENKVPLLFRTQDVALPKEFAGIWTEPHEITRVVRALPPASLEAAPKRHAGLGLDAYATVSSPIRRYADLLNQEQVLSFMASGSPRLDAAELGNLLPLLSSRLDAVTQVQRFRPRYWKLLYFRQQGDKKWWDAVVSEENEAFATISLPWAQLLVRGRRRQFDEKTYPGMPVQVRLGKVNPLMNEIQIVEVREA